MAIFKFLVLAIAIICSLWIACWVIFGIAQSVNYAKYNKPFNHSIGFWWFIVAGLAWSAFFVFF